MTASGGSYSPTLGAKMAIRLGIMKSTKTWRKEILIVGFWRRKDVAFNT
jgi:hypothetical protein